SGEQSHLRLTRNAGHHADRLARRCGTDSRLPGEGRAEIFPANGRSAFFRRTHASSGRQTYTPRANSRLETRVTAKHTFQFERPVHAIAAGVFCKSVPAETAARFAKTRRALRRSAPSKPGSV